MDTFTKTMSPNDYGELQAETAMITNIIASLGGASAFIMQHQHRLWEYAMAIAAIQTDKSIRTILDIGTGQSPLPAILNAMGYEVTGSDVGGQPPGWGNMAWINHAESGIKKRYDVIMAISTIEHIEAWDVSLRRWWASADKMLIVTTDVTPRGQQMTSAHMRSYEIGDLHDVMLGLPGAVDVGKVDTTYYGDFVYSYSFGIVAIKKETVKEEKVHVKETKPEGKESKGKRSYSSV